MTEIGTKIKKLTKDKLVVAIYNRASLYTTENIEIKGNFLHFLFNKKPFIINMDSVKRIEYISDKKVYRIVTLIETTATGKLIELKDDLLIIEIDDKVRNKPYYYTLNKRFILGMKIVDKDYIDDE